MSEAVISEPLTREYARAYAKEKGITYYSISEPDVAELNAYLKKEYARHNAENPMLNYSVPSRKTLISEIHTIVGEPGIKSAFLRVENLDDWWNREAISFNPDGFIGFAGWADDRNVQPFLRAFINWIDEYMTEGTTNE